jgi:hypothetical protein
LLQIFLLHDLASVFGSDESAIRSESNLGKPEEKHLVHELQLGLADRWKSFIELETTFRLRDICEHFCVNARTIALLKPRLEFDNYIPQVHVISHKTTNTSRKIIALENSNVRTHKLKSMSSHLTSPDKAAECLLTAM